MTLLVLSPPPSAEVEVKPQLPEKCNPHLRWETALMIALLRAAKRVLTRQRGLEGQLRARIQCP